MAAAVEVALEMMALVADGCKVVIIVGLIGVLNVVTKHIVTVGGVFRPPITPNVFFLLMVPYEFSHVVELLRSFDDEGI